jgi:hypothetical protein
MVFLAIEIREIRRQGIDECGEFLACAGFHAIEIFPERRDTQLAQPPSETAVDHRPLVGCEVYAGVGMYESAYAIEIFMRELEIDAYLFGEFDTGFLLLHGIPVVESR